MTHVNSRAGRGLVSLVVPVFNEAQGIGVFYDRATRALMALDALDYELLFVDDGSRDGSYDQLRAFAACRSRQ